MKKPLLVSSSLLAGLRICLGRSDRFRARVVRPALGRHLDRTRRRRRLSSMGGGAIGVGAADLARARSRGRARRPVTGAEFVYDMPAFHIEA